MRTDAADRLDDVADGTLPDPPVAALGALAADAPLGPLWLVGGEPTLRGDLPALVLALSRAHAGPLGVATDGLALASAERLQMLRKAGLTHVRIALHTARPDAHDWLVGRDGAWHKVPA